MSTRRLLSAVLFLSLAATAQLASADGEPIYVADDTDDVLTIKNDLGESVIFDVSEDRAMVSEIFGLNDKYVNPADPVSLVTGVLDLSCLKNHYFDTYTLIPPQFDMWGQLLRPGWCELTTYDCVDGVWSMDTTIVDLTECVD